MLRNAEQRQPLSWKHALIGDVVDSLDRWHAHAVPAQICRRQPAGPVIEVQDVRRPAEAGAPPGKLRGYQRQTGKAKIVVRPIEAFRPAIWRSRALIERW